MLQKFLTGKINKSWFAVNDFVKIEMNNFNMQTNVISVDRVENDYFWNTLISLDQNVYINKNVFGICYAYVLSQILLTSLCLHRWVLYDINSIDFFYLQVLKNLIEEGQKPLGHDTNGGNIYEGPRT